MLLLAVVIVDPVVVETNLRIELLLGTYVIPGTRMKLPPPLSPTSNSLAEACVKVPVYPVKFTDRASEGVPETPSIVRLPDNPVATTSSAAVGTAASTHAVVADQLPPAALIVRVAASTGVEQKIRNANTVRNLIIAASLSLSLSGTDQCTMRWKKS